MALRKSQQLLPEVFRSSRNNKFLNATVDQLISEPNNQKINSFIGRKFALNFSVGDSYVQEISNLRQNYQLEPAVVYRTAGGSVDSVSGIIDFLNSIRFYNGDTANQDNLFAQEYYNWSSFVDFDKLVNYGEYFWLPQGPDPVQVFGSTVDATQDYTVVRDTSGPYYGLDGESSPKTNPPLYLGREGSYTFDVNQSGVGFWIQTEPGLTGISSSQSNLSTREILGVSNNGEDVGTVTFNVPPADAQTRFTEMTVTAEVDLATTLTYSQIHNAAKSAFIDAYDSIDKFTEFDGKTVVFLNTTDDERAWEQGSPYDAYPYDAATTVGGTGSYDTASRIEVADRYDIYKIAVVLIGGVETITLTRVADFPIGTKVNIKQGADYGNRQVYKQADGKLDIVPPITAPLQTLYYQDSVDATRFGRIILVDIDATQTIAIETDVLGREDYTSPNGVVFTNGLKVEFDTSVIPAQYQNNTYYVEGVGTAIKLVDVNTLVTPERYTQNSSEGYDSTLFDVGNFDGTLNSPILQDYIVANRRCIDNNAWARTNRWFHRSVIEATAAYNNFSGVIDDNQRAKRPIIEFIPNLTLFNMGITSKMPVTVIDADETDALSNVNGQLGYFADGVALTPGMTVIFAADTDSNVADKIYRVDYIDQDSDDNTDKIINLVQIDTVVENDCVLSILGATNQGRIYYYATGSWYLAQQKTRINQEPLFDVFDGDHTSFGDTDKYPSTNFVGSKLFSYKRNTAAANDSILGFGLTYKNFANIGDIVFENNFISDTFRYTKLTGPVGVIVKSGHVHVYDDTGTGRSLLNGWTRVLDDSKQYQIVTHEVTADELFTFEIGTEPADTVEQSLQVFVNSEFQTPSKYTQIVQNNRYYITFDTALRIDDVVTIQVYSTMPNSLGFYKIPRNLENNANNADFDSLTLGQVRNHLMEISRSIRDFSGSVLGSNNLRDLNYVQYPGKILQHSSGAILANYLFTQENTNVIKSTVFAMEEYTRFKNRFIDNIDKLDLDLRDIPGAVDAILEFMAGAKTADFPFYYSDMAAWSTEKSLVLRTVDDASERTFEFNDQFDLTQISQRGVLIYLLRGNTRTQLIQGVDYEFDSVSPAFTLVADYVLQAGDVFQIYEYPNTDGSFIPSTPTKLGMWPKYSPQKYIDNTYSSPKTVVQGHDGSIWVGYGDVRDDIVLELEKRIYNNIKTQYNADIFNFSDVLAGYWRDPASELSSELAIIRNLWGSWTQKNRVNQTLNSTFDADNKFTWNYRNSVTKDQKSRLPGFWRGIYRWLYDTDTPHTTPWEMLGLTQKPVWWDDRYGAGPYTSGNSILWEDLRDGKLYTGAVDDTFTVQTTRVRPGLLDFIPTDPQGNLRAPADFAIVGSTITNANDPWAFGDQSPQETAWRRSSEWPFAAQIIAAIKKPAKYISTMFDTNLVERNADFGQILLNDKTYRPTLGDYRIHSVADADGNVNRVEGFNQFISNYLRFNDMSAADAQTRIQNLELNLCYQLGGFSDKEFLKVVAASATPSSSNETIFIPDEDYEIVLGKSVPLERVVYSGVKITKQSVGYKITGYDIQNPFFRVIPSQQSNNRQTATVGGVNLLIFNDFQNYSVDIPYGTVLRSPQQVVDFLVSYQRYLESKGLLFTESLAENGEAKDFVLTAKEFIFWTQQNWPVDSVFSASPVYDQLVVEREFTTTDDFTKSITLRDANSVAIKPTNYNISRIDNRTTITVNTENTVLYSAVLSPIQYEHVIVFNNTTVFNDILYQPQLGNRQERMKLIGFKVGGWNGTIHAPGFFINEDKFEIWQANRDYKRADYVSFRNKIYTAKRDHDGKSTFDYTDWILADNLKVGLQPNPANKANRFKEFFDIDQLNLESSTDKAGKGLIGFRNRSYLENLGLDDVSQVKFYQGILGSKGTPEVINKLINAALTNLDQEINYYEEWGFRVGEYGSVDSNQVVEFIVDESLAQNNPTIVEFLDTGDARDSSRITLAPGNLYKKPNNYSKNIFATRTVNTLNRDIANAGYPRLDDVDYTLYNLNDYATLNDVLETVGRGTKIWSARNGSTWGVSRVSETGVVVISVKSTTNGYLNFVTDVNHGLVKDDIVVVKTDAAYGGIYRIVTMSAPNKFSVLSDVEMNFTEELPVPLYKFTSARFEQLKNTSSATPLYGWDKNEIIWVDRDQNNRWATYQKNEPWASTTAKTSNEISGDDHFGTSVSISKDALTALVGAPDSGTGRVVPYVLNNSRVLVETNSITLEDIGSTIDGLGYSVASGDQWHAIGAPDSYGARGLVAVYYRDAAGVFNLRQVITPNGIGSNAQYGYDVAISGDERYMFASAPGSDTVYAYALETVATENEKSSTVNADGINSVFALTFAPRGTYSVLVEDGNGKIYIPYKDFTISGSDITFTSLPASGLKIVVRETSHYVQIGSFTGSDTSTGDRFGSSIDTDHEGRTLIVGSPNADVADSTSTVHTDAGEAYVFGLIVEEFTANSSTASYTTSTTLADKIFVTVNGTPQTRTSASAGGDGSSINFFSVSGNTVTFRYTPSDGDIVKVYTGEYAEIQKLDQNVSGQTPTDSEEFGTSVALDTYGTMLAVGSPGEDETNPNTGSVFVFADTGLRFGSVTTNSATGISSTTGDSIFINDREVSLSTTSSDAADIVSDIDLAVIALVDAAAGTAANTLTVTSSSIDSNKKLRIRPGTGSTFTSGARFDPYRLIQKLNHPSAYENENWGKRVAFDKHIPVGGLSTQNLVVTSDSASTLKRTRYDLNTDTTSPTYGEYLTTFDFYSTRFVDRETQSGAVYVYEFLSALAPETLLNPPQYGYVQQLQSGDIDVLDQFGSAVAYYDDKIIVGSRLDDQVAVNGGGVYEFTNPLRAPGWAQYRQEADKVDVSLINRIVDYNRNSDEIVNFLDYLDPFKGKIAGQAQEELDYVTPYDPAQYSTDGIGNWNDEQVGRVWWDLQTASILEYEQGEFDYRRNHWGQFFPGSSIDVYEWIESEYLPSEYVEQVGDGKPRHADDTRYSVGLVFNPSSGSTVTRYYYWVKNRISVPDVEFRNISTSAVAQLIEDPRASGLKYVELLSPRALALVNIKSDLEDRNLVLSINYDVTPNEGVLHSEFELMGRGDPDQAIPTRIYNKLVDSLTGRDTRGRPVPDPELSEAERYGVLSKPRQTMFANRQGAVKVFVDYCNSIFRTVPIGCICKLTQLQMQEAEPTVNSGEWDKRVASIVERNYLNLQTLATGYRVLVATDENNDDYWTIYTLNSDKTWNLTRIQAYDTNNYWDRATWYAQGFSAETIPDYQVDTMGDLLTLTPSVGEVALVLSNLVGSRSHYEYQTDGTWREVIIERGTIQLRDTLYDYSQINFGSVIGYDAGAFDFGYFDQFPSTELRNIINGVSQDIFVEEFAVTNRFNVDVNLASNLNELFFRLVEYSLHEDIRQVDWVFKTSFIRVLHKLRNLEQYPTFRNDNNEFIEAYINEVKPYKTKIREYVAKFDGTETFRGDVTDFDVHSFYDSALGYFRKPSGDFVGDEILQTQGLTQPWSENYSYSVNTIEIITAGSGYIDDPVITIAAPDLPGGIQATAIARSNTDSLIRVTVTNPGSGYITTPEITVSGAGTGAKLVSRMINNTVREFDITMRFDRVTYTATVKDWAANTTYDHLDLVAHKNTVTGVQEVYQVSATGGFTSGSTFSAEAADGTTVLTVYADENISNNADRIAAFYTPTPGMLGDDLNFLQRGTDYPGVRVTGSGFDREPGFDVAAFDNIPFDDFEIDSDGLTVLSGASSLDTVIRSTFADLALGTRPEDIDVTGGGFVDEYSSHAPEEVVPGIVFDTLDMEVYTDPSDDFEYDGNSFEIVNRSYTGDGVTSTFSYASSAKKEDVDRIFVWVDTTAQRSITVDYENRTVTLPSAPSSGAGVYVYGYGVTGERPTHEEVFVGTGGAINFTMGVDVTLAQQTFVLIDGVKQILDVDYSVFQVEPGKTLLVFTEAPAAGAHIHAFTYNQDSSRQAFTETHTQEISLVEGTQTYDLDRTIQYARPLEGNTVVELDNLRLRPTNAKHYIADGSTITFAVPTSAGETATTVADGDIRVTVISRDDIGKINPATNKILFIDYVVNASDGSSSRTITFFSPPSSGDTVIVSVRSGAQYLISGDTITLTSLTDFSTGDRLYITSFANHDPLRIQTKVFVGLGSDIVATQIGFDNEVSGYDSEGFDELSVSGVSTSRYTLDRTITNLDYLWVTLDGVKLHPGQYSIDDQGRLSLEGQELGPNSLVVVTSFSENVIQPTIGFRIFNDMLGNWEYRRIAHDNTAILAQTLNPADERIYVDDASKLPFASTDSKIPGVIFVGNERVTYWEIDHENNYVSNIRRSTAGTRWATIHRVGTRVVDAGLEQALPATDTHTRVWYTAGTGTPANGLGLQSANTVNANFLKAKEAQVPAYLIELNANTYLPNGYIEPGYVEERSD